MNQISTKHGPRASVNVYIKDQKTEKRDLNDFDRGMDVGARQTGLGMSETADLWGFSYTRVHKARVANCFSLGKRH